MTKYYLLGSTMTELTQIVEELGLQKFVAKQIADWVYRKKVTSIDEMRNISLPNRQKLESICEVGRITPSMSQKSNDGTVKYLFKNHEDKLVETVMIPDKERYTLCVSSQVGCKINCHFCMTGKQGFNGNLSANEIMNQIYSVEESDLLTNLVFMGMGEPLDNYTEVIKCLEIITSDYGMAWSPKRINVSTTGIIPKLKLFLEESDANLAISLHSPISEQRAEIMPIEKAYPIAEVVDILKDYDWSKQRRVSFEYIMFEGFNDSLKHAERLAKLIRGIEARVNLIRFHVIPGVDLRSSSQQTMEQFRDFLNKKGIPATIRTSRGEDISAACGMLSTQKKSSIN